MGNRLSKIYTRTGDDGTTGLGDGTRVAEGEPAGRGVRNGRRNQQRHRGGVGRRRSAGRRCGVASPRYSTIFSISAGNCASRDIA